MVAAGLQGTMHAACWGTGGARQEGIWPCYVNPCGLISALHVPHPCLLAQPLSPSCVGCSEIGWDRRQFSVVDRGEEGNSSWVTLEYRSPDGEMGARARKGRVWRMPGNSPWWRWDDGGPMEGWVRGQPAFLAERDSLC